MVHEPQQFRQKQHRFPFLVLCIVALICGIAIWRIAALTSQKTLERISRTGESRVNLYADALRDTLEKYRHIPYLLSRDTRIRNLLRGELDVIRVNPHLEDFAAAAGGLIFVMDHTGNTIASSNWRTPQSLIGSNFAFRPYFQDARKGRSGGYYTVGLKTRKPGFFISYPVLTDGMLQGVVVVKADLEKLQRSWSESGETVIVSDAYGVLFLSSIPQWKYRSLRPLPEKTANWLREVQYLQHPLTPLTVTRQAADNGNIIHLDDSTFLEQSQQLLEYGWRIHYLSNLAQVNTSSRLAVAIGAGVATTAFLILLFLRERRQKLISRQQVREAQAIQLLNERLREEITLHEETERTLRLTQTELIQAGKLAALGRMSAAIAHELNQPVTAIRTFIASCRIFLERGQADKVVENLQFINRLTERMAKITGQLKIFARKSRSTHEKVDLVVVTEKVLSLTGPQLEQNGITVERHLPPNGQAIIQGNALQLEQVLNNLIYNSRDAMQDSEEKILRITLTLTSLTAILTCHDSGPGISSEALDALFEPFFTTKDIGLGLGLGLSIAYGIVLEMGGTIKGDNHSSGGAVFTLTLPLVNASGLHHNKDCTA